MLQYAIKCSDEEAGVGKSKSTVVYLYMLQREWGVQLEYSSACSKKEWGIQLKYSSACYKREWRVELKYSSACYKKEWGVQLKYLSACYKKEWGVQLKYSELDTSVATSDHMGAFHQNIYKENNMMEPWLIAGWNGHRSWSLVNLQQVTVYMYTVVGKIMG